MYDVTTYEPYEFMTYYTYNTDHAYFPGLGFPVFQNYRKRSWYLPDVQTTVQRNVLAVAIYGFPNNNYWANRIVITQQQSGCKKTGRGPL